MDADSDLIELALGGETWGILGARYLPPMVGPHGKPPYFFGFAPVRLPARAAAFFIQFAPPRHGRAGLFTQPASM